MTAKGQRGSKQPTPRLDGAIDVLKGEQQRGQRSPQT